MSDESRGSNPYGELAPAAPQTGEIIASSRAMQEVQAAIIMAKHDRRDPIRATEAALAECKRPTLAQTAIYSYPRGGTNVEGPSIRLAEAIARAWGNLQFGIIEVGRDGDESSMLAYAWDLQSNSMARQEFKVKHVRDSRNDGKKILTDERDIYETTANAGARRLRACILKLIPGDIVDACMERCKLTLEQAMGKVEEAIPRMLEKFAAIQVTQQMIEKRLKKNVSALTYHDLVNLGNVLTSINDGMGSVEDYFEPQEKPQDKPVGTADAARAAASRAAGKKPEESKRGPGRPPAKPAAPAQEQAAQEELGLGEELEAFRRKLSEYIDTRVPVADQPWLRKRLGEAKTDSELQKLDSEMLDKYEVF